MKVERDEIVEELLENYIQTRLAPPEQYEEEPYEGDGFGDESYDEDFDD